MFSKKHDKWQNRTQKNDILRKQQSTNMTNREIANVLQEISIILALDDIAFKPRAYERAAQEIASQDKEIIQTYAKEGRKGIQAIPSVGAAIAEKIEELLNTGKMQYYEKLKKKYPIDVLDLYNIEGLGPKTIKTLYKKLNIRTLDDLTEAIEKGKIEKLKGFTKKTEKNLLQSIHAQQLYKDRFILGFMEPEIQSILKALKKAEGTTKVEVAGSARRMKETIGDLDIIALTSKPKTLIKTFATLPDMKTVITKGEKKANIRMNSGLEVDVRVASPKYYGASLLYFSGSKNHNIKMRTIASKKGYILNEYGLFKKTKTKQQYIAGKTEEEIYKKLGLHFIPPEIREDPEALDWAKKQPLPTLMGHNDLKGDLQIQTTWSDGKHTMKEMALEAQKQGMKYILVTDHTKSLSIANGLTEKRFKQQFKEIDKLNKEFKGTFTILKGTEIEILKDGKLDLSNDILKQFDIIGLGIHSYFKMTRKAMTERICKALNNPYPTILFHPTGRVIQKRPPYDVDMNKLLETAKKTNTALEINAYPDRLDLKDTYIKQALKQKLQFTISSDAHHKDHYRYLKYGIGQARRGWAQKKDVLNTAPVKTLLLKLRRKTTK